MPSQPQNIAFFAAADAEPVLVNWVSDHLGLRPADGPVPEDAGGLFLRADREGLALVEAGRVLRGDFARLLPRTVPNNLNGELLVRAARRKDGPPDPTAVDATAGLGEDAFLLAAAGFTVTLYERDPIIAALLCDALRRGAGHPALAPIVARMTLRMEDSIAALPHLTPPPDVVVLDPMFPQRQKSGRIKKKFQLLQQLEQPCADEEALLRAALACAPGRIVIKRPGKGPYLAGIRPSHSLKGGSIRYDCIVPPQPQKP